MATQDPSRNPDNVDGPWFVDRACIDCGAVRQIAPDLIARVDRRSAVSRQPSTPDEESAMRLAAQVCPTTSLRRDPPAGRERGLLPHHLGHDVWLAGHNAQSSFGANSFLVERAWGRAMVDGPRWHPDIVTWLDERGGLDHVLLTHRDDIGDAQRYAEHFGAQSWIHEDDLDAAPWATDVLRGAADTTIEDELVAVPIPGHTRGSVAFVLEEDVLFSGDSLFWSRRRGDLGIHVKQTWYSLPAQLDSLEHLNATHRFAWVVAGHGDRHRTDADDMAVRLAALVTRLRTA